jgi:hypothetical protein
VCALRGFLPMTISSIHFQKAQVEFAEKHNFRTEKKEPEYLLDKQYRKSNEYLKLNDPKELYQEQIKLRKQNHSRGFAPHLKDVYWEAVVNLDEKHTLADVKKIADFIQQKYHLQTCSIALHHDEGYKDKDSTVKYNHHAHLCFLTMDKGISTMRKIRSKELRQMQSEVAHLLGLERGKENSKATRLDHKQYREKARELAEKDELYEKELYSLEQALDTAHDRDLETQEELLTLKEQKAIVEAERKKYKDEADHIASEYRALQALNKTLHTREELDKALAALRTQYEDRLAKEVEKTNTLNSTVNGLKAQKDYFDKAYNAELEVHQQLQKENKELRAELEKVTKERDAFVVITQTVYQFLHTIFPTFDKNNPKQSMKNIYLAWKAQHQKSTETPQKRSQRDESTIKRVEVQQTSQSQSMSVLDTSKEEKRYKVVISRQEYEITAKDIHDWLSDYPEDRESIAKQLNDNDRREVFGEPTQAPQQKQSLFARVKHSFER